MHAIAKQSTHHQYSVVISEEFSYPSFIINSLSPCLHQQIRYRPVNRLGLFFSAGIEKVAYLEFLGANNDGLQTPAV